MAAAAPDDAVVVNDVPLLVENGLAGRRTTWSSSSTRRRTSGSTGSSGPRPDRPRPTRGADGRPGDPRGPRCAGRRRRASTTPATSTDLGPPGRRACGRELGPPSAEPGTVGGRGCRTRRRTRWRHDVRSPTSQRTVAPVRGRSPTTSPRGDQPTAIDELERRIRAGEQDVVLLGATGTGKSATTAWLIERLQRPTLVMAPNKTLAAQLANEFRELLPNNAVEYFVSLLRLLPARGVHPADGHLHREGLARSTRRSSGCGTRRPTACSPGATSSSSRSVSCIYGLGHAAGVRRPHGAGCRSATTVERDKLLRRFVDIQYTRNDLAFTRGTFRVRGDTIEIFPVYEEHAVRIEMFGDEIERLMTLHPLTGEVAHRGRRAVRLPGHPLRRRPGAHGAGDRAASRPSSRSGWPSSSGRASCSRRSGCACARPTTSR